MKPSLSRPLESWLCSDNPRRAAAAEVRCRHTGAFCGQDGFCHRGGECFEWAPWERFDAEIAVVVHDLRRGTLDLEAGLDALSFWTEARDAPLDEDEPCAHVRFAEQRFSPCAP